MNVDENSRKLKELSLLYDISENLKKSLEIEEILEPILKIIAEHMGMIRGTLTLLNRFNKEIIIEYAYGLSEFQQKKGKYRLGEGITGKVIDSGEPAIIPKISEEPYFLNRTGARKDTSKNEISFMCVPIKTDNTTIGALSVDRLFEGNVSLDEDVRLLTIISSMIAQAVQFRQNIMEERQKLSEENEKLLEEIQTKFEPKNIFGKSQAMKTVFNSIAKVAKSDATVLLRGESGTGKELIAHAIHHMSNRSLKAFVKVNCAALSDTIIESELFGHERGAFTDAVSTRKGRFELANGGTIFLDEIGDLPVKTQIKLLRVIQEKEFERVGGSVTFKTDVRIIAATNQDLEKFIQQRVFREDLYYRLNVFPIYMPPLRERNSDILLLAEHFIQKYNNFNDKQVKKLSSPTVEILIRYHWPGNVRELENCMERAVLLCESDTICPQHLPPYMCGSTAQQNDDSLNLDKTIKNLEHILILDALRVCEGNITKAASKLGITDRKLGIRIKKHNIDVEEYKPKKKGK